MSDHERGAYTPPTSDAPLSFDPRQPVRGARPIPFTLILSAIVLAVLVAAIFMFYQSGVRQAGEAPPTVGEPLAAIKAPAPPGAQPKDPAAGLQIYQGDATGPMETAPTFAPPPEQPQPRPSTPVVVTQAPPAKPAPQSATAQALKPTLPAATPAPAEKAAPPPEKKAPAPEPKAAAGGFAVQIGAVSSTALADRAWNEAVAAAPGLAAGKGKSVERIERNGGTLYRTAVTGFASRADAQAFCDRLKAAGKACFVR
ncbi:MAG: SPOR domain-containing protein [Pseudomonadota bacterium]|jgi:cell division protein FtsN